jgi:ABC-type nitrate/sulfonate/bicarbonate transport system permease component
MNALVKAGGRVGVVLAVLLAWQALSVTGALPSQEFASVTGTFGALWDELGSAQLWHAIADTLSGWALGLLLGVGLAILIGTVLGLNRFAYRSAIPVIEFLKTVPIIAILPLAILLFGATLKMKFLLIAFGVFWPMVIQVIYGVRSIDPIVRDTARVLQLRGVRRFTVVTMPSAAPFIMTGLRVAAATALVLDIVAELIGGASGLGLAILSAQNSGPSAVGTMYAYIVVTGLLGVLLTGLFILLERRVLHWHPSQRNLRPQDVG